MTAGTRTLRICAVAALLLSAMTSGTTASWASMSDPQRALVPAYFYPDHWTVGNPWQSMCDGLRPFPGSIAVMNPDSGPSNAANPDYQIVLSYCQAAGQRVIGYVHTSYGRRSQRAVKRDIDAYYRYYPRIDGIFLDEMSNDPTMEAYYRSLHRHVKSKSPEGNLLVGNPGAAAQTSWQLDVPVADAVVVFEGSASSFSRWTPPTWVLTQPPSKIVQLVHSAADEATMATSCETTGATNNGFAYVTDDVLSNPWDTLPSFWQSEPQHCWR